MLNSLVLQPNLAHVGYMRRCVGVVPVPTGHATVYIGYI